MFGRILKAPSFATVQTAGEQMFLGSIVINCVASRSVVFEMSRAEPHQDFVVPGPDSMIRRPAAESFRNGIDFDVVNGRQRPRRLLGFRNR